MAFPWLPLAIVASSVIGSGVQASSAKSANKASSEEASTNRQWQERMSNTAHQREIKDLAEAGLNPILSAKYGGASSGSPVMPNIRNIAEGFGQQSISTANAVADIKLKKAMTETEETKQVSNLAGASLSNSAQLLKNIEAEIQAKYRDVLDMKSKFMLSPMGRNLYKWGQLTSTLGNIVRGSGSFFKGSVGRN